MEQKKEIANKFIKVRPSTKNKLDKIGKKSETYDDVILRNINEIEFLKKEIAKITTYDKLIVRNGISKYEQITKKDGEVGGADDSMLFIPTP